MKLSKQTLLSYWYPYLCQTDVCDVITTLYRRCCCTRIICCGTSLLLSSGDNLAVSMIGKMMWTNTASRHLNCVSSKRVQLFLCPRAPNFLFNESIISFFSMLSLSYHYGTAVRHAPVMMSIKMMRMMLKSSFFAKNDFRATFKQRQYKSLMCRILYRKDVVTLI